MTEGPTEGSTSRWAWVYTDTARRVFLLVLMSLGLAVLLVDYVRLPVRDYVQGEVADRDIRAPASFQFVDWERTEAQQRAAEDAVRPIFDHDGIYAGVVSERITASFVQARRALKHAINIGGLQGPEELHPQQLEIINQEFLTSLPQGVELENATRAGLKDLFWSAEVEDEMLRLFSWTMKHYLMISKERMPQSTGALSIIAIGTDEIEEKFVDSLDSYRLLDEAREDLWEVSEEEVLSDLERRVSVGLASSMVHENLIYNHSRTENRKREARQQVANLLIRVDRGTVIVREGDVLNSQQTRTISALQQKGSGVGQLAITGAFMAFCALFLGVIYQFGRGYIKKFSTRPRDLAAVGLTLLLILCMARLDMEISVALSSLMGLGSAPSTFWFMVPFAGGAMLVRVLVNSETALIWVLVAAVMTGLVMEQQVLYTIFFMASGLSAVVALGHGSERAGVLKAGVMAGLINAALALLINLVRAHMGDIAALGPSAAAQPMWDVVAAFTGGVFSGILVLGLLPLFELGGFVTDYKLLELANLNHPLLRQLMLKAPGTYHHSVSVAQLCEAAAEAVGANALQTRVACYFHDIGKALQPQYFIENQRGGPNPHDRLTPRTSARIIVAHAVDGAAIARQYNLPQPVIDGITQHHGTSLVQYFYAKALKEAAPGEVVDESVFRYQGELPNSRETGIIMLADRVEAACRTLPDKSAENIRALIQKLVNSSITDGQLEQCPLTIKELYVVVDAFTDALLGIYHHRIEYPGLPVKSANGALAEEQTSAPIITLEVTNPLRESGILPQVPGEEHGGE